MRLFESTGNRYLFVAIGVGVLFGWLASTLNELRRFDVPWPGDVFYGLRTGAVVLIAWVLAKIQSGRKWVALLTGYMICAETDLASDNLLWTVLTSLPTGMFGLVVAEVGWITAENSG